MDAMDYIRAADVFLLPSRAEAQGIVVLEAMALRTPVIAADIDGIPEMIHHERTGLLFPHSCPQKLVEGLARFAEDAALRDRCVGNAEELYWKEYSRARQSERRAEAIHVMLDSGEGVQ